MLRSFRRSHLILLCSAALFALAAEWAWAQWGGFGGGGGGRRRGRGRGFGEHMWIDPPARDIFPGDAFTFARIDYSNDFSSGMEWQGQGWRTDYPQADLNLPWRLSEMTTIKVNMTEDNKIEHAVVKLTEPELFNYPWVVMSAVASMHLDEAQRDGLRSYMLRGGFVLVDDFWGDYAWENFTYEMEQVLPSSEYPIVDIPLDHELFHIVFGIKQVPQIVSWQHYDDYLQTGETWERSHDYPSGDTKPHCRGIFDKNGRLMMVIMHNTDLGDGWEREGVDPNYFLEFSVRRAFPMGINIVVYAMTH